VLLHQFPSVVYGAAGLNWCDYYRKTGWVAAAADVVAKEAQ